MPTSDVIQEMESLGLGDPKTEDSGLTVESLEAKRRAVAEISKMADIMSRLVVEVRDTARDLNTALLEMTEELRSLTEGKR